MHEFDYLVFNTAIGLIIMRTLRVLPIVTVCLAAYAMPSLVNAQQQAENEPPKLEKLEEGAAPSVTIRGSSPSKQIIETREGGQVTSVTVKSGKSTYKVKPNSPSGSSVPGDLQSDATRAAQWQVMEFDLQRDPDAKKAASRTDAVPPPLSPAVQPTKK